MLSLSVVKIIPSFDPAVIFVSSSKLIIFNLFKSDISFFKFSTAVSYSIFDFLSAILSVLFNLMFISSSYSV